MRLSETAATMALRPVGEVAARSEPSLCRLLDADKSGQLTRARERFSSFCKKLRRTISEFLNVNGNLVLFVHKCFVVYCCMCPFQCSNDAFVFCCGVQATWILLKSPTWLQKRRLLHRIVSAICGALN